MVKVLRVRQAGTGSGGTGNAKPAPGIMAGARDNAVGDKDSPAVLRAVANFREKARKQIERTPIGSRGKL